YAVLLPWRVSLVFLTLVVLAWAQWGFGLALSMLVHWFVLIAACVTVAALSSGAAVLTTVAIAPLAPILRLFPTVDSGSVAAWLEAWWRKPTEREREGINDALLSLGTMRRNPFIRILFVGVAVACAQTVAAYAATVWALVSLLLQW